LRPGQRLRDARGAGVMAERRGRVVRIGRRAAGGVVGADDFEIIAQHRRESGGIGGEQAADALGPLGRAGQGEPAGGGGEVVVAAAGVGVEVKDALVLALERADELHERGVFEDVGEVARVVVVAVVHATAAEGVAADTGTLTTVLRTRSGEPATAREGLCASTGKKTAIAPVSATSTEPSAKGLKKIRSRPGVKSSSTARLPTSVSSMSSRPAT